MRPVGRRQNDEANTSAEPGYTLVDAVVHYELDGWRFALDATNLPNRKHYGICCYGECYQGAKRAVTLSAAVKF